MPKTANRCVPEVRNLALLDLARAMCKRFTAAIEAAKSSDETTDPNCN